MTNNRARLIKSLLLDLITVRHLIAEAERTADPVEQERQLVEAERLEEQLVASMIVVGIAGVDFPKPSSRPAPA